MTEIIAYCGIACHTCPIYQSTREANKGRRDEIRTEIARLCREHYGMDFIAADINDCDGCRTAGGRLFFGCRDCRIRQCAMPKGLENCAQCPDFVCEQLGKFLAAEPSAKARLDSLRASIH